MTDLPPLCRQCARPIRKDTTRVWLETKPGDFHETRFSRHIVVDRYPTTIDECRRLTNRHVTAVRKRTDGTIRSFFEWDGLSYADEFFCSSEHAQLFGRLAAVRGLATKDYNEAIQRRWTNAKRD